MEHCLNEQDILDVQNMDELPDDDPRRRHLEVCPKCRGLAEACGLFLEPGDVSDLDGFDEADAELKRRLDEAVAREPVVLKPRGKPARRRPWLAIAAVFALCAVGLTADELLRMRADPAPIVGERLRGDAEVSGLVTTITGDSLQLTWSLAPEADSYIFLFLDADMKEIGRRTFEWPVLDMASMDLPALTVFCQALAASQGDTLARSAIVRIRPAQG